MRRGAALLLATGMPVAQIALCPWYEEDTMVHIGEQMKAEERAITERAVAVYKARVADRDGR
ncbi:hypothetical protein ACFQ60_00110 [Streptomyces zhihengii]|uniref:Uncharacterized protein n=1 Tax=Streptomyces zhihengii TaxID=1818004 RepID=A0ABS2V7A5_9ACTN|nr:hypothetical protein [Streptomyces zhihengii]MBM9624807.1 hypothetical protein [Streptomyces zhihengii]